MFLVIVTFQITFQLSRRISFKFMIMSASADKNANDDTATKNLFLPAWKMVHSVIKNQTYNNEREKMVKGQLGEVNWIRDEVWFQNQTEERGCCPFAKVLYKNRYAPDFRCCTSRLHLIDPLRAIGGADYLGFLRGNNKNLTILIQGDSLAEQHFLGMICYAWSKHSLPVELKRVSQQSDHHPGTAWQATITIGKHKKDGNDILFTIQYLRWDVPVIAPKENYDAFDVPDFLFLGGWHHGSNGKDSIANFVQRMRTHLDDRGERVFVIDDLPGHFPGGKYRKDGNYVSTNCTQNPYHGPKEAPSQNENISSAIENLTNVTLLQVSKLYIHRGNAHIGVVPDRKMDCRHWCIAPGVLDALTRNTLAAIYNSL